MLRGRRRGRRRDVVAGTGTAAAAARLLILVLVVLASPPLSTHHQTPPLSKSCSALRLLPLRQPRVLTAPSRHRPASSHLRIPVTAAPLHSTTTDAEGGRNDSSKLMASRSKSPNSSRSKSESPRSLDVRSSSPFFASAPSTSASASTSTAAPLEKNDGGDRPPPPPPLSVSIHPHPPGYPPSDTVVRRQIESYCLNDPDDDDRGEGEGERPSTTAPAPTPPREAEEGEGEEDRGAEAAPGGAKRRRGRELERELRLADEIGEYTRRAVEAAAAVAARARRIAGKEEAGEIGTETESAAIAPSSESTTTTTTDDGIGGGEEAEEEAERSAATSERERELDGIENEGEEVRLEAVRPESPFEEREEAAVGSVAASEERRDGSGGPPSARAKKHLFSSSTEEFGVGPKKKVPVVRDWREGDFEDMRSLLRRASSSTGLPASGAVADPEGPLDLDCRDVRSVADSYDAEDGGCMLVATVDDDDDDDDDDHPRRVRVLGTAAMIVGTEIADFRRTFGGAPPSSPISSSGPREVVVTGVVRRVCFLTIVHDRAGMPPSPAEAGSGDARVVRGSATILRALMAEIERRAERAGVDQVAVLAYPKSSFPGRLDAETLRGLGYRDLSTSRLVSGGGGADDTVVRFAKFFDRTKGGDEAPPKKEKGGSMRGFWAGRKIASSSDDGDEAMPTEKRGSTSTWFRTISAAGSDGGRDEGRRKGSTSSRSGTKGAGIGDTMDEPQPTSTWFRTKGATLADGRDERRTKGSAYTWSRANDIATGDVGDEAPTNGPTSTWSGMQQASSSSGVMKSSTRNTDGMKGATRSGGTENGAAGDVDTNASRKGGIPFGIPALFIASFCLGLGSTELEGDNKSFGNELSSEEEERIREEWKLQRTAERDLERLKRYEERQRSNLERMKEDLRRLKEGPY